ncbi:MAG: hypothetical protein ACR2JB_19425 [Bryobacteraceae bacterium]
MSTLATTYKSPLFKMTHTTPTCLWNDSASLAELTYSIEHGAVGRHLQSGNRARGSEERVAYLE